MKKLVLALVLAWSAGAFAQQPPEGTRLPDGRVMRQREILTERPSGFWTSNRPAKGGAYRWRLLGIGVVIATGMGFVVLRVMRNAREAREARLRELPRT